MTTPLDHLNDAARAVKSAVQSLEAAKEATNAGVSLLDLPSQAEERWHAILERARIVELLIVLREVQDKLPAVTIEVGGP